MSRSTILKFVVVIVGVLFFVQIIFFNKNQLDSTNTLNSEAEIVEKEIRSLKVEHKGIKRKLTRLENELREIASTVPPSFLTGFEDHEARLTQFIDYLQSPIFKEIGGNFTLSRAMEYKKRPVSRHSMDFTFSFDFNYLYEAEDFFDYVLGQDYYPIQVKGLNLRRQNNDKTEGTLDVAFIIPSELSKLSGLNGGGQ